MASNSSTLRAKSSEAMRTSEGSADSSGLGLGTARKSPNARRIPSTPSTVCESLSSVLSPATSSGHASDVCSSRCSRVKIQQGSPVFSTSSTATEVDIGSTERRANDSVEAGISNVVEPPADGGGADGYASDPQAGNASRSRGMKRQRQQMPRVQQPQNVQDASGPGCSPGSFKRVSDEASPQAPSSDPRSPQRKKDCFEQSQHLRLYGCSTPAARYRSHRNQRSTLDEREELMCVRGQAPGGMFAGAMVCTERSGGREHGQRFDARIDVEMPGDCGVGASEQSSMENTPVQDCTQTAFTGARVPLPRSADKAEQDNMCFDVYDQESSNGEIHGGEQSCPGKTSERVKGIGHGGEQSSKQRPPAVLCSTDKGPSSVGSTTRVEEAAAFRKAGITGSEEPSELFRMLRRHLKWRWGGVVNKLSGNHWILRDKTCTKTGKLGVDKFAIQEDVVTYVRGVLAETATLGNEGGPREGDPDRDTRKNPDLGSGDEHIREVDRAATGSNRREALTLAPKGQALQAALEALNPSNAPAVLKQREKEFNQVLYFVTNSVVKAAGGSLYLCGVPGTGKTLTMKHVQAKVRTTFSEVDIPVPAFYSFTGTEFTTPDAMYGALWHAVTGGKEIPWRGDKEKKLANKLTYRQKMPTATSPMLVVVLDEIDQLMSQNRQVLRKLFEWADAPKSRLVLVGLANSLDFDINFSDLKKAPQRLLFQSYTPEDLASILTERVGEIVHHSAIQFCAKKAAATTGDARRAINTCREAVVLAVRELQDKRDSADIEDEREEYAQGGGKDLVTIRHMAKAVAAGNAAKYAGAIGDLSFYAKVVLAVAAAAVENVSDQRGVSGAISCRGVRLTQGELQEKCMGAWRRLQTGGVGPSQVEFTGIIDLLAASGLLTLKSKKHAGGRARELVLRIEFADLEAALGDEPFFKTATEIA